MIKKTPQVDKWLQSLSKHGWTYSSFLDGTSGGWLLERNGEKLYINLNPYWLCFTLAVTGNIEDNSALCKRCLELCRRYFMCKFSLSQSGKLLLQIELPSTNLEYSHCCKAVEALSVYHQQYQCLQSGGASIHSQGISSSQTQNARKSEFFPKESLIFYFKAIEHLKWALKDNLGNNHWQAVYKGYDRKFYVYVYFNQSWAYFQIPINQIPSSQENQLFFYSYLLQINEQIYWAKLGVDEDRQIVLMLDIPLEMFDLERFLLATKTLANYADSLAYEIQIMANLDKEEKLASLMSENRLLSG